MYFLKDNEFWLDCQFVIGLWVCYWTVLNLLIRERILYCFKQFVYLCRKDPKICNQLVMLWKYFLWADLSCFKMPCCLWVNIIELHALDCTNHFIEDFSSSGMADTQLAMDLTALNRPKLLNQQSNWAGTVWPGPPPPRSRCLRLDHDDGSLPFHRWTNG